MIQKGAIYAGSFDPVTHGHLDLIRRGIKMFGRLIVAVAKNPGKKALFTVEERVRLLRESVKQLKRVQVESFDGLLVSYALKKNIRVLMRGLRAVSDFEYEYQMALRNRKLCPQVEIVYMMPSEDYSYVSSSFVKEVVSLGGSVRHFVPPRVEAALRVKMEQR